MQYSISTVKKFFSNSNIEQVIIPEIQRDYVWGHREIDFFVNTIIDDFKEYSEAAERLNGTFRPKSRKESQDQSEFILYKLDQDYSSNIGFIYAYEDDKYDRKLFLIDGQQRFMTLYLLLLSLAARTDGRVFFQRYFKDEILKVDYKVREATHEFLKKFIPYILDGGSLDKLLFKSWFFDEYARDTTISSIISNYKLIDDLMETVPPLKFREYVEDHVKFWFFNTNISYQGEELYIYLNSRGETVEKNENIKALLLEPLSSAKDKESWGKKWEEWQDLFWRFKEDHKSDKDDGFNSFLTSLQIIEAINKNPDEYNSTDKVRDLEQSLEESRLFDLNLNDIDCYIQALKLLVIDLPLEFDKIINHYKSFGTVTELDKMLQIKKWMNGDPDTKNKINLFPILMFIKEKFVNADATLSKNIDWVCIYRWIRFFYNVLRFDTVPKTPYISYRNTLLLMSDFLSKGKTDIAEIITIEDDDEFSVSVSILTDEEKFKFMLYANPPKNVKRETLEILFWEIEDHKLNQGRIKFILKCCDIENFKKYPKKIDLGLIKTVFLRFDEFFNLNTDLRIRGTLTYGQKILKVGSSSTFDGSRYSFGKGTIELRELIWKDDLKDTVYSDLIKDLSSLPIDEPVENFIDTAINNFIKSSQKRDKWYFPFVKHSDILNFCFDKIICFTDEDDEIILFPGTYASNVCISLEAFMKKHNLH